MRRLKQLLADKNVVTFIGVVLISLVLYGFYKWSVDSQMELVSVPYALETIPARTRITQDMIAYTDVKKGSIKGNIITDVQNGLLVSVDGQYKYTNVNAVIPKGSFFYAEAIVNESDLPDSFLIDIPEGKVAYNFDVDTKTTYGNSMYPGNYVDIYIRTTENGKILFGKLLENVKILATKDGGGNHVFESNEEQRQSSQLILALEPDMHALLRVAEVLSQYNEDVSMSVIAVPIDATPKEDGEEIMVEVNSEYIRDYIEGRSHFVDY